MRRAIAQLALLVFCCTTAYADCAVDMSSTHTTRDEITQECRLNSAGNAYVIVKEVTWQIIWTGIASPFDSKNLDITGGGECSSGGFSL